MIEPPQKDRSIQVCYLVDIKGLIWLVIDKKRLRFAFRYARFSRYRDFLDANFAT